MNSILRNKPVQLILFCSWLFAGCAQGPVIGGTKPANGIRDERQPVLPSIPRELGELFAYPELDHLVGLAFDDNPTLAAARAALREAQENLNARAGVEYYPAVNADLAASRQKVSPAAAGLPDGKGNVFNLYHASVLVSYTFDIFGRGRRELEGLKRQVDYTNYQLEAAHLALAANIVTTAVKEASLRDELGALKDILVSQEKQVALLEKQLLLGGASRAEVLAQRTQVEQSRAVLPALEKEIAQTRDQLCLLLGKMPDEAAALPVFDLNNFRPAQDIPHDVPALLVRQRPDIKAAEALLRAAGAGVGVATADLYPQITLSGSYGPEAGSLGDLFKPDNMVWNIGAGVLQPLFNGGSLRAKRRAAVAVYDAAAAQFRQTVLSAFHDVADVFRALESDELTLKAQAEAQAAAYDSMALAQKQFEAGAVSYILLLNAERQYQSARVSYIQARSARLADMAALFQALGGRWWK